MSAEKSYVRDMLLSNAYSLKAKIDDISHICYIMRTFHEDIFKTIKMSRAIGVLDYEKHEHELLSLAEQIDQIISTIKNFSVVAEEYCEYIETCGIPMSPADSLLWEEVSKESDPCKLFY